MSEDHLYRPVTGINNTEFHALPALVDYNIFFLGNNGTWRVFPRIKSVVDGREKGVRWNRKKAAIERGL